MKKAMQEIIMNIKSKALCANAKKKLNILQTHMKTGWASQSVCTHKKTMKCQIEKIR